MDAEQLIVDAANRGIGLAGSGDFVTELMAALLKLLGRELVGQLRPGDRPSVLLPCSVGLDGGKENPGGVLYLDDRLVVVSTKGVFRPQTEIRVVPLAEVTVLERTTQEGTRRTGNRTVLNFRSPQGTTSLGLYAQQMHQRAIFMAEGMLTGGVRFSWGDDEEPAEQATSDPKA